MIEQPSLFDKPSGPSRCQCCGQKIRKQTSWRETRKRTVREAQALAVAGVPIEWLSRTDGPVSSRLSAIRGAPKRPTHRLRLFYAILLGGPMTVRECAELAGFDYEKSGSWKRFSELKQMGLVRPTGRYRNPNGTAPAEIYESEVSV